MARTRMGLFLSKEEETKLEEWCHERATSTRLQFRAAIVLEYARGDSVNEIAKRHETSERTVSRWRRRFVSDRLAGLAKRVAEVRGVVADVGMAGAEKAVAVGEVIADVGVAGVKKAADAGGAIADLGMAGAKKAVDAGGVVAETGVAGAKQAAGAAIFAAQVMQIGFRKTLDATVPVANWFSGLSATAQGLLASNLANDLNGLLQDMVKGSSTIYDRAMDSVFNATHIGGGLHRLFDGGHTLYGAFKASIGVSAEDSFFEEVFGTILGLLRDVTTPGGLPLGNWNKETFDSVAGWLQSHFHIPKSWFYDLNTYDAAELIGGAIGVIALALAWNSADAETFAKLVGSMGLSAAITANPLLLIVTVVALAKAYNKARETAEYAAFADGLLKGASTAGATLTAVALVGVAGGPAGVALLVGLVAGVLANQATENVSVADIGDFVAKHITEIANEVKDMAAGGREWWPEVAAGGLRFSWRPTG